MPNHSKTRCLAIGEENSSGVVRNGKGYIIDGKEVKGIKLRWKIYRPRIEAMERAAGFTLSKKGKRISLKMIEQNRQSKRNAEEAEIPEEPAAVQAESDSGSGSSSEKEQKVEETKKKSPTMKKKPVKRQRVI